MNIIQIGHFWCLLFRFGVFGITLGARTDTMGFGIIESDVPNRVPSLGHLPPTPSEHPRSNTRRLGGFPTPVWCPERVWLMVVMQQEECTAHTLLQQTAHHLARECPKYLVPCNYCSLSIVYKDRQFHETYCMLRPLHCQFCNKLVHQQDLAEHEEHECEWRTIKCTYCNVSLCYRDWKQHKLTCGSSATGPPD